MCSVSMRPLGHVLSLDQAEIESKLCSIDGPITALQPFIISNEDVLNYLFHVALLIRNISGISAIFEI